MEIKEACTILNVELNISIQQLKEAFKYKSHAIHPDKFPEQFRERANKEFQEIKEAYELLKLLIQSQEVNEEETKQDSEEKTPSNHLGVPLDFFTNKAGQNENIKQLLAERVFIGIDFGTSTTVVSYITVDDEKGVLSATPIDIAQYDELGRVNEFHLVPSYIAWTGKDVLVGSGAAELKSDYQLGTNIWFSFKMELGKDLGPQYCNSQLNGRNGTPALKTPKDAAVIFFNYLREQIEEFVRKKNLPGNICYSVSVPAAFESNQRQDLCDALREAGIDLPAHGIIDEPNAAFISYFHDTFSNEADIIGTFRERKKDILVFDFGAGTCDISILEVMVHDDRLISKNKSISRFIALGGDNIDRQIVRKYLLQQFLDQNNITEDEFTSNEINQALIPRLQGAAENLKIICCKYIQNNWDGANLQPFIESDRTFTGNNLPTTQVAHCKGSLAKPSLSIPNFADVMAPFLNPNESSDSSQHQDITSIFKPIFNALEKAELAKDELDMILFIGGSAENPFVQSRIKEYFGRFVETSDLGDTRTPVSCGAALNSFMINGLNCEIVRSITSEPIFVLAKNDNLFEIVSAGTEIPSEEFIYTDLEITKDGQQKLQLPICVTSKNKILQVIEVKAPFSSPFNRGDSIILKCFINNNKLLNVSGNVGGHDIQCTLLNPLANEELTGEETQYLQAKQKLNESISTNKGPPDIDTVSEFAYACAKADHNIEAAEAYITAERLHPEYDFATDICFYYSLAGKTKLSDKYAKIAYERNPSSTNAFNLAISLNNYGDIEGYEKYMGLAYKSDPRDPVVLELYGRLLINKNRTTEGMEMVQSAFNQFKDAFDQGDLRTQDYSRLSSAARTLGRHDVVSEVEKKQMESHQNFQEYDEDNLAGAKNVNLRIRG